MAQIGTDFCVVVPTGGTFAAPVACNIIAAVPSVAGSPTTDSTITLNKNGSAADAAYTSMTWTHPALVGAVATKTVALAAGDALTITVNTLGTGATANSGSVTVWLQRA